MALEQWRPVAGYEGRYEISDHGRLRNGAGHILRPQLVNSGYLVTHLYRDGRRRIATIHRLVAAAFVANPENKPEVNHKESPKTNNVATNLEWATRLENVQHSIENGMIPPDVKRRPVVGVPVVGGLEVRFESVKDAEMHFSGRKSSAIGHSMRRQNGSAFGHRWSFANA